MASGVERDVRLRNIKVLSRVTGAFIRWPCVVRIALVEGGRGGMCGGTERVRVAAVMRAGRRRVRVRWGRCIVVADVSVTVVEDEVAKVALLMLRG